MKGRAGAQHQPHGRGDERTKRVAGLFWNRGGPGSLLDAASGIRPDAFCFHVAVGEEEEVEEEVREKSFSRNFPAYEQVDYWSFRGFWHDFSTAVASYASAAGTSYEVEQTGNCPVGGLAVFW